MNLKEPAKESQTGKRHGGLINHCFATLFIDYLCVIKDSLLTVKRKVFYVLFCINTSGSYSSNRGVFHTHINTDCGKKKTVLKPEILRIIIEAKGQSKGSRPSQEMVKYSQEVDKCQS